MTWFMRQRQDFIRAQLQAYGMIRRADIAARFEVTIQVASADIQTFIAEHPEAIEYDRAAKCYTYEDTAALATHSAPAESPHEPAAKPRDPRDRNCDFCGPGWTGAHKYRCPRAHEDNGEGGPVDG